MQNVKNCLCLTFYILLWSVVLGLGFTVYAEAPSEILMSEDFSSENLGNWIVEELGSKSSISVEDGELCLKTANSKDNPRIYPSFPTSLEYERLSVEFDVRFEGAKESRQFALRDTGENWFNVFSYVSDKKVALGQTYPSNTDFTLENSKVYNVRYEFYNEDKPYVSVYINDTYLGNVTAPEKWNGKLKKIYFLMYSGSSVESSTYIDNIVIKVKPDKFFYDSPSKFSVDSLAFYKQGSRSYYLTDGNMVAEATVSSEKDTDARFILAQYIKDKNGLSLYKIVSDSAQMKAGESNDFKVPIDIENAENSVLKVMIVDSLEAMCPVMPVSCLFPRWDSSFITHPNSISSYNYTTFLGAGERERIFSESKSFLENELKSVIDMEENEFVSYINSITNSRLYIDQPYKKAGLLCQRLASLYKKTGNEKYARYSALTMYLAAKEYETSSKLIYDKFFAYMNVIPTYMVYAYDIIYNSPCFEELSALYGEDIRKITEDYFFSTVMDMYNALNERIYTNITPYGISGAFMTAVTLNHSDLIRLFIPWIDNILSGKHFYADGMWEEGTVDYHNQVSGGLKLTLSVLNSCFRDEDSYNDTFFNITLPDKNLLDRWPILKKADNVAKALKYPDGRPMCVNDTVFADPFTKKAEDPINEGYLVNTVMSNFKHYSLTGGDTNDASTLTLNFEAQTMANAHNHTDYLQMTYWSAGVELLPDAGYPRGSGTPQHYFFKSPLAHNTTWVWRADTNYYKPKDCMESALLAYDDGDRSDKQVQLAEASQRGQNYDYADIKRRALMMIKIDNNRFYAVDVNRLSGGDAHEFYMRSSEDEDVTLTSEAPMEQKEGTLEDYFKNSGQEQGLKGLNSLVNLRSLCKNPQVADGGNAFSFSWKGERTKSTLNVFLNDVKDSEAIFSTIPSLRRAKDDIDLFDDYFSTQLYRRKIISDNSVTKFCAVLEGVRDSQTPLVKNVEWLYPEDSSQMSVAIKVSFEDFYDIIYLSNDTLEREAFGITFSANYAAVRINGDNSVLWGYIYSDGKIEYGDYLLLGKSCINSNIYDTVTDNTFTGENEIIIEEVSNTEILSGNFVMCMMTDNFGYGYEITNAYNKNGKTHLVIKDMPAFKMENASAKLMYHDGFILNEEKNNTKYFYNMFSKKKFDNVKACVKLSVFEKKKST